MMRTRLALVLVAVAAIGCTSKANGTGGNGTGGNGTGGSAGAGGGGGDGGGAGQGGGGGGGEVTCMGKTKPMQADDTWTLLSGGLSRTVNVHVPSSYDPATPMPLVLNFHGYTSNASQEDLLSQMSAKSDSAGFIAIHPEGTDSSWNAGACCGTAAQNGVDDIGFVKDILAAASDKLCVDTHRIFATGM